MLLWKRLITGSYWNGRDTQVSITTAIFATFPYVQWISMVCLERSAKRVATENVLKYLGLLVARWRRACSSNKNQDGNRRQVGNTTQHKGRKTLFSKHILERADKKLEFVANSSYHDSYDADQRSKQFRKKKVKEEYDTARRLRRCKRVRYLITTMAKEGK